MAGGGGTGGASPPGQAGSLTARRQPGRQNPSLEHLLAQKVPRSLPLPVPPAPAGSVPRRQRGWRKVTVGAASRYLFPGSFQPPSSSVGWGRTRRGGRNNDNKRGGGAYSILGGKKGRLALVLWGGNGGDASFYVFSFFGTKRDGGMSFPGSFLGRGVEFSKALLAA